jgi:hypothetical protein
MSDLAEFQRAFGRALAEATSVADPALARALSVHRNTSVKAALDALRDNHPVTAALTGVEAFEACAAAFAHARPPADPRLCVYGEGFEAFLAAWPPFADAPYLREVARLERLVLEALFAADAAALHGDDLTAGLDPDRPLRLHPGARFAAFSGPAAGIWLAHQPGAEPDALERLDWRPGAALITRPGDEVLVTPIDRSALALLEACAAGLPLVDAAEAAAGPGLADRFSTLIAAGAFAARPRPQKGSSS